MRSLISRSLPVQMSDSVRRSRSFGARAAFGDSGHAALYLGAFTIAVMGAASVLAAPSANAAVAAKATDSKGPIVSILQPQYNDQLKGTVQVLVGIEARQFTPQSIEMLVDGHSATDGPIKLESFPSANFTWDTTRFSDGPHRLTVVVTDTQGFRGSSDVNVYINNGHKSDALAPDLTWLGVKNGDTWRGIVDLDLKVTDNFGVKYLFVMLNPASEPLKKPAAFSWFLNRPPYSVRFDSRDAADGAYTLRALAYDALENEGASPSVNINIANRAINPTYGPNNAMQTPSLNNLQTVPQIDKSNATRSPQDVPVPQVTDSSSATEPIVSDGAVSDTGQNVVSPATDGANANFVSGHLNPAEAFARAETRPTRNTDNIATSRVAPSANNGARIAAANSRTATTNTPNYDGKSALPLAAPRVLPRVAASTRATKAAPVPMTATNSRIGEAVSGPAPLTQGNTERLASIDVGARAVARVAAGDAPSLSASIIDARDGSISSVSDNHGSARPISHESHSGKVTLPQVAPRFAAIPAQLTPANPTQLGTLESAPLAPNLSAGQRSGANPNFPNPSLSPVAPTQRATPPLLAALPSPSIARGVSRAAITVTPMSSVLNAMPKMHRIIKGQTLGWVAAHYKLPVDVLVAHNNLDPKKPLEAGQEIALPQTLAISYAGQPVTGDVAAMMVGSTSITPFRFLFEKQGGKLQWDEKNGRVTAQNATHQVTLTIGSRNATVNQKEVMLDLAAFLVSGRTMVPLRFFEKALQARVEWEPATGRLFVAMRQ